MKRSRARSPAALEFARRQRASANEFGSTVWQWVRNRQIHGQKFRREYPIPPYTADFCCIELKLILEVDGARHCNDNGRERDRCRDDFLDRQGYRVVRISGYDLLQDGKRAYQMICDEVAKRMEALRVNSQSSKR